MRCLRVDRKALVPGAGAFFGIGGPASGPVALSYGYGDSGVKRRVDLDSAQAIVKMHEIL